MILICNVNKIQNAQQPNSNTNFNSHSDDRSLSLPFASNDHEKEADDHKLNEIAFNGNHEDHQQQHQNLVELLPLPANQHQPTLSAATDGADSGIGSDSPKAAAGTITATVAGEGDNSQQPIAETKVSIFVD
jgi:hypothetical protein